jgi:hypothetical protein
MQGPIEQSIGLTIAGNAFLQGHDIGRFWPDSTIFIFCRAVRFVMGDRIAAPDPLVWFRSLAGDRHGLRLHAVRRERSDLADWMDVGLIGGGSAWLIESGGGSKLCRWSGEWSHSNQVADHDQPWSVTYRGAPAAPLPAAADLDRAEQDFAAALLAIYLFARRIHSHFSEYFEDALAILALRKPPDPNFASTVVPAGFLSPKAERVIGACCTAWVFGGMGAWNDGAYGGEHEMEGDRLTEALFDHLQKALTAAANSTCAGPL